jgi:hypothetical protein
VPNDDDDDDNNIESQGGQLRHTVTCIDTGCVFFIQVRENTGTKFCNSYTNL